MSEVSFASPLSVDEIVARLDARAREWRESSLPAGLRRQKIVGLRILRNGRQFRLEPRGGPQRPYVPALLGCVQPDGNGARIEAHFAPALVTIFTLLLGSALMLALSVVAHTVFFIFAGIVLLPGGHAISRALAGSERHGLEHILREIAGMAVGSASASSASPST